MERIDQERYEVTVQLDDFTTEHFKDGIFK